MSKQLLLATELKNKVITALKIVQQDIYWKPDKDYKHLQTRKLYGHLPASSSLEDYNKIIQTLANSKNAELYIYVWKEQVFYPTVVSTYKKRIWLVMISLSGIVETSFPPTNPKEYLSNRLFHYQGSLQEFLK